jgi:hypothetical protein
LFATSDSSSSIVVGVEKPISLYYDPIVPKPKKARKAKWELNKMFQNIANGLLNCLGQRQ